MTDMDAAAKALGQALAKTNSSVQATPNANGQTGALTRVGTVSAVTRETSITGTVVYVMFGSSGGTPIVGTQYLTGVPCSLIGGCVPNVGENVLVLNEGKSWYCLGGFAQNWVTYTPSFVTAGGSPSGYTIHGQYKTDGHTCQVQIYFTPGTGFNGGSGQMKFGLPFAAVSSLEQDIFCKCYVSNGANFTGFSLCSGSYTYPYFPASATASNMLPAQNCNVGTSTTGTGIPQVAGAYTFLSGNNIVINGTYAI